MSNLNRQIRFASHEEIENINDTYLIFQIGKETYSIPIATVTEIIRLVKITPIPDVYNYIKGVINLRGLVIPVMDIRLRMGMEEKAYDDRTCVIVIKVNNLNLGMIVDQVSEVLNIPSESIDSPPNVDSEGRELQTNMFVSGIGKIGDQIKIIINLEKLVFSSNLEKYQVNLIDAT